MKKRTQVYLDSFGENLTPEQIAMIKKSSFYAMADLQDAWEEFGQAVFESITRSWVSFVSFSIILLMFMFSICDLLI